MQLISVVQVVLIHLALAASAVLTEEPPVRFTEVAQIAQRSDASELQAQAEQLLRDGNPAEAATAYARAIEAAPGNYDLKVDFAMLLLSLKRNAEAAAVAADMIAHAPRVAPAYYLHGQALRALDRNADAAESLRKYVQMKASDARGYYGLGFALMASGDRAGAAKAFRTYLSLDHESDEHELVERVRLALDSL